MLDVRRDQMLTVFKIKNRLFHFFGDEEKMDAWLCTPSPLLGGIVPAAMIAINREEKLLKIIEAQLEGEFP